MPLGLRVVGLVLAVAFSMGVLSQSADAATTRWCSCLAYYQSFNGLPSTGTPGFGAQDYPAWLAKQKDKNGRARFTVTGLTPNPTRASALDRTSMFWSGKRAGNPFGHVALLIETKYDAKTQMWTFLFQDANGAWSPKQTVKGPFTDSKTGCNNVKVARMSTKDLGGLSFYQISSTGR